MEFKQGNWHGENAVILDEDDETVFFIVGTYKQTELEEIKAGIDRDDPEIISEYNDYLFCAERGEWNEQQ